MKHREAKYMKKEFFILALVFTIVALGFSVVNFLDADPQANYVGSDTCKMCHKDKHEDWSKTLHPKMIQETNPSTVIGDWTTNNTLTFEGKTTTMFTKGGKYYVTTIGPDSEKYTYEAIYTIGSYWKQRYLTKFENGELHILPVQWNVETQEWVDYHGLKKHKPGDGAYWSDKQRIWQNKCAGCHVTGLQINYNAANDTYNSTWADNGAGCEACHGPGSEHVAGGGDKTKITKTFSSEVCGSCHIRGKDASGKYGFPFGYKPGDNVSDYYQPDQPKIGEVTKRFWPTGDSKSHHQQYLDWIQSEHAEALETLKKSEHAQDFCLQCHSEDYRHAEEGEKPTLQTAEFSVECVTCHSPHKAVNEHQLRKEGKELCGECHTTGESKPGDAVHHPNVEMFTGSIHDKAGVSCNNCHMPKTAKSAIAYDISSHTFKVVLPETGIEYNMPDSCTSCHTDKTKEEKQAEIDARQSEVKALIEEIEPLMTATEEAIKAKEEEGVSEEKLATAKDAYNIAKYNLDMAKEDGSFGIHNYDKSIELLNEAKKKANEAKAAAEETKAPLSTLALIFGLVIAVYLLSKRN